MRKIGLALPGVEESTAYGSPALKVRGKLLACLPAHRSAEPGSLAVRVGFDDRAELLAVAPDVYYVTEHYIGYSAVLVRLPRVTRDVLRDLLGMAHKFVTAHEARPLTIAEPPQARLIPAQRLTAIRSMLGERRRRQSVIGRHPP